MRFTDLFIRRPVLAGVVSALIFFIGSSIIERRPMKKISALTTPASTGRRMKRSVKRIA